MTNIQKFFGSSPGVIFIFTFVLCSMTTDKFFVVVSTFSQTLQAGGRAQLLSFMALLIVILGFVSVAVSLIVGRIWDALFYFLGGGYDRKEYEYIREALLENLPKDSDVAKFITSSRIQPLYGTILHSYAPTSYIEWLGRRWTSFNNSGLQATALFIGVASAYLQAWIIQTNWPEISFAFVFGLIFPAVTMYIGVARLKEVLSSEELFCRSLVEPELDKSVKEIAKSITSRGGSTDGIPELGAQL